MYTEAKKKARYYSKGPSLTDQSQAKDTDLNIIVRQLAATGVVRGKAGEPLPFTDYTNGPADLREHLEAVKNLKDLRGELPKELQQLTLEQIVTLDNKQLAQYYHHAKQQTDQQTPPKPPEPTAKPTETPK